MANCQWINGWFFLLPAYTGREVWGGCCLLPEPQCGVQVLQQDHSTDPVPQSWNLCQVLQTALDLRSVPKVPTPNSISNTHNYTNHYTQSYISSKRHHTNQQTSKHQLTNIKTPTNKHHQINQQTSKHHLTKINTLTNKHQYTTNKINTPTNKTSIHKHQHTNQQTSIYQPTSEISQEKLLT